MTPPTDKTHDRLAALAAEWRDRAERIAPRRIGFVTEHSLGESKARKEDADELDRLRATLAADQPEVGEARDGD